jgi:hypothetical protein
MTREEQEAFGKYKERIAKKRHDAISRAALTGK